MAKPLLEYLNRGLKWRQPRALKMEYELRAGAETDLAVFRNDTWKRGGRLGFPDGREYKATTNFWHTRFEIQTARERTRITHSHNGVLHTTGAVTPSREARDLEELPWLPSLGSYLLVPMHSDSAGGVAAAAGR